MQGIASLQARTHFVVLLAAAAVVACQPTAVPTPTPQVAAAPQLVPAPAAMTLTGGAPFNIARTTAIIVDAGNP